MRRYQCIIRNVTVLSVFVLFISCATSEQVTQTVKDQTIDMGDYAVSVPPGDGWKVETDKDKLTVQFTKQTKSFLGGALPMTVIQVGQNRVLQEKWNLSEEDTADDFRNMEEVGMMMLGVMPGNYELHDVKKDTMRMEGKKLYTMSYKTMGGKWFGTDKIQEATLYVYFPQDFREKHKFYTFLMGEVHERHKIRESDPALVYAVINSLRMRQQ
jgi:hypothetical protein